MKICIYLYNAFRTALTAGARVETVGGNIPLEIVPVEYIPKVINNCGKSAYRNFTRRKSARRDFVVQEFCLWNFACRNSTGRNLPVGILPIEILPYGILPTGNIVCCRDQWDGLIWSWGSLVGHSYDRFSKANRGHGLVKMDEFCC